MSATRELRPVRGETAVEDFQACMGDGGPVWCCAVRTNPYGVPCDYKASKTIQVATERRGYPVCGTHAGVFERTWIEVIESADRQKIGERYKSPPRGATDVDARALALMPKPAFPPEPEITINGHRLSIGEAMTLRVALEWFASSLNDAAEKSATDWLYLSNLDWIRRKAGLLKD